jgi:phage pi2 protein 07
LSSPQVIIERVKARRALSTPTRTPSKLLVDKTPEAILYQNEKIGDCAATFDQQTVTSAAKEEVTFSTEMEKKLNQNKGTQIFLPKERTNGWMYIRNTLWRSIKICTEKNTEQASNMLLTYLKIEPSNMFYDRYYHEGKKMIQMGLNYQRSSANRNLKKKIKGKIILSDIFNHNHFRSHNTMHVCCLRINRQENNDLNRNVG